MVTLDETGRQENGIDSLQHRTGQVVARRVLLIILILLKIGAEDFNIALAAEKNDSLVKARNAVNDIEFAARTPDRRLGCLRRYPEDIQSLSSWSSAPASSTGPMPWVSFVLSSSSYL
jgi:hypothetical protein